MQFLIALLISMFNYKYGHRKQFASHISERGANVNVNDILERGTKNYFLVNNTPIHWTSKHQEKQRIPSSIPEDKHRIPSSIPSNAMLPTKHGPIPSSAMLPTKHGGFIQDHFTQDKA